MTTEMEIKTGEAATGSVWNKNSWHWEEKDYNRVAEQNLLLALKGVEFCIQEGESVEFTKIEPKGFASISVRKGKKVIVFEYSIAIRFKAGEVEGSIKIPEFSNEELEPVLRVECPDDSIKEFMRKQGTVAVRKALSSFIAFINSVETGESILEADKKRREDELARAKQAEAEKGLEKQKIADEVKAQEREALASKTFVEASVWNPNSYHWETRKLDKWASEWILSRLDKSEFSDVSVTGEAENSIRKGKKISIFNLRIEGKYRNQTFSVPSFSNEEGDDEIPKVSFDSGDLKKELVSKLSDSVFKDFLAAMKSQ
jgi:activator of HSP90 ATPase